MIIAYRIIYFGVQKIFSFRTILTVTVTDWGFNNSFVLIWFSYPVSIINPKVQPSVGVKFGKSKICVCNRTFETHDQGIDNTIEWNCLNSPNAGKLFNV